MGKNTFDSLIHQLGKRFRVALQLLSHGIELTSEFAHFVALLEFNVATGLDGVVRESVELLSADAPSAEERRWEWLSGDVTVCDSRHVFG